MEGASIIMQCLLLFFFLFLLSSSTFFFFVFFFFSIFFFFCFFFFFFVFWLFSSLLLHCLPFSFLFFLLNKFLENEYMVIIVFRFRLDSSDWPGEIHVSCCHNWQHRNLITLFRVGSGLLCAQRSSDILEVEHGVGPPLPASKSIFYSSSAVSVGRMQFCFLPSMWHLFSP